MKHHDEWINMYLRGEKEIESERDISDRVFLLYL